MNEIIDKIEALKAAGFEPISVLMTQKFFDELSEPRFNTARNSCKGFATIPTKLNGLPIKIRLDQESLYSIEVA